MATDYVYEELFDPDLTNAMGYKLRDDVNGVILTGFADDQAFAARNIMSAERVTNLVQRLLREIDLPVNPLKSSAIILVDGKIVKDNLSLEDGTFIDSIGEGEVVKYLGCTFSGEMVVNEGSLKQFSSDL